MSMPFMCGAVPVNFTVPVMEPPPAAFTFWLKTTAPMQTNTSAGSTAESLHPYGFLMNSLLVSQFSRVPELLCWHRLQPQLLRNLSFLAVENIVGLQGTQIEHQVPCLIRFNVVGKRGHGCAIQTGHEDSVDVLVSGTALGARAVGEVVGQNGPA